MKPLNQYKHFQLFIVVRAALLALALVVVLWGLGAGLQHRAQAAERLPQETQAVYLPLALKEYPWNNPFGVEVIHNLTPDFPPTGMLTQLGVQWVRLNDRISWRTLQPNAGAPIQWQLLADFDAELRLLRQRGFTPIVVVDDYPHWATDNSVRNDGQPTSCGPLLDDRVDDFAAFAAALADRYSGFEFNVHYWELGNEPDVDPNLVDPDNEFGCWGDIDDPYYGGERYGAMVIAVSQAVKAVDPQAQIWLGGLLLDTPDSSQAGESGHSGSPENFLEGVLRAGAAPYFDVVPYHWHTGYWVDENRDFDNNGFSVWDANGGGTVGKARFLRSVMAEYSVDKPVFLDEAGFGCPVGDGRPWCDAPDEQFYQIQADYVIRSYSRGLSEGVAGFLWFVLDSPAWRDSALLNVDGSPRPVFMAYQYFIRQMAHATFLYPVIYTDEIEGYAFQRPSGGFQVLWAKEDQIVTVAIPKSNFVAAYTRDGAAMAVTPTLTNYEITFGFSPVYILLRNP